MLYKPNLVDKALKKICVDLTQLPVSLVKFSDWDIGERNCCLLGEKQVKCALLDGAVKGERLLEEKGEETERGEDELNVMATYTHPALVYAIHDMTKDK